jgi:hypothetical protein
MSGERWVVVDRVVADRTDFHDCPNRPRQREKIDGNEGIETKDDMNAIIMAGYRKLALENHPDRGGSTTKMQQINRAMERLRKKLL